MKTIVFTLLLGTLSQTGAFAYAHWEGYCQQGGQVVISPGNSQSITKVQQSYPQATLTAYITGSSPLTKATLYSDNAGTPLANPLTCSSRGYFSFYAADGQLDLTFSGTGISAPFTWGAVQGFNPSNDWIDPTSLPYGADPSGVANSAAAWQSAITASISSGKPILCPSGTYNMGTTNLTTGTIASGFSIYGPSGNCILSWGSGASGTALTIGSTGANSQSISLSGIKLLTASTTQNGLKALRTRQLSMVNMTIEGVAGNDAITTDCITLDGTASGDSIYTTATNVNCNHVKKGLVVGQNVTTWNSVNFNVFGPGNSSDPVVAGSYGVDYGAYGQADGFTFAGGNMEHVQYGSMSAGGAGYAMRGMSQFGQRAESGNITASVNLEQFSFQNKFFGNVGFKSTGAGRCINGNDQVAVGTQNSSRPTVNCLTSTLNLNPGIIAAGNTPMAAIHMTIPSTSTFPIVRAGLDSGGLVPFQFNATGALTRLAQSSTYWAAQSGDPNTTVGPPVVSGTYTSGATVTGASGDTCLLKFSGGTMGGLAYITLTGTNTIAGGTAFTVLDGGYGYGGVAPTAATLINGIDSYPLPSSNGATCSGTIVVSTTLGTGVTGHLVTNTNGTQGTTLLVGEGTRYNVVPTYNTSTRIYQLPDPGAGQTVKYINNGTGVSTGALCWQAGGFSAGFGSGFCTYQQAHGSKPGYFTANLGSSVGKFAVNNAGDGSGTDVFTVDTAGVIVANGLKTTGAAGSKKVVCVDTATGQLYASSSGNNCSN